MGHALLTASERRSCRSAVAGTSDPGYQAHIQYAGRPATAGTGGRCLCAVADCPGSPPAAGRAWVPGCRARTLGPYPLSTTDRPGCLDAARHELVILIDHPASIPTDARHGLTRC